MELVRSLSCAVLSNGSLIFVGGYGCVVDAPTAVQAQEYFEEGKQALDKLLEVRFFPLTLLQRARIHATPAGRAEARDSCRRSSQGRSRRREHPVNAPSLGPSARFASRLGTCCTHLRPLLTVTPFSADSRRTGHVHDIGRT